MALLWLFSRQMPLALLPFAIYSTFHVATYTRSNLLPTLQPPPAGQKPVGGLGEEIGKFVKNNYDTSMTIVAVLEVALWFRILFSALLFQAGSWILLVVYTAFVRVRHSQSSFMQSAVAQLTDRADGALANPNVPPVAKSVWDQTKGVARQAADATDINRFTRPAGPPKKAQ